MDEQTVENRVVELNKLLKNKEAQTVLQQLPALFRQDNSYPPLYILAAESLNQLDAAEEQQLFNNALNEFNDWEPFYKLGYHFVGVGNDSFAIPFLERANKLSPGNMAVIIELSLALPAVFQPQLALDLLSSIDYKKNFWMHYQYHWCSLLCGKENGYASFVTFGKEEINQATDMEERQKYNILFALQKLEEGYRRLALLDEPASNIQTWQFIQYGTAILNYFEEEDVAGGRWVAVWTDERQIRNILADLEAYLKLSGRMPTSVIVRDERNSEIIGRAIATILQIPFGYIWKEGSNDEGQLIVAADHAEWKPTFLEEIKENQTYFALNLNWLQRSSYTPDIAGLLSQHLSYPWDGGGMRWDEETKSVSHIPVDDRDAAVIAAELAAIDPDENEERAKILAFYQPLFPHMKGGAQGGKHRIPFLVDTPVPGSHFN